MDWVSTDEFLRLREACKGATWEGGASVSDLSVNQDLDLFAAAPYKAALKINSGSVLLILDYSDSQA